MTIGFEFQSSSLSSVRKSDCAIVAITSESRAAVAEGCSQFRNPAEGDLPPFEAGTIGLVKRQETDNTKCVLQGTVKCVDP